LEHLKPERSANRKCDLECAHFERAEPIEPGVIIRAIGFGEWRADG